jgi:uncharacterized phage protein gp47/JayE
MYAIPSLKDLAERARQAFRTYLPGSDAWIWPNNVYASAKVVAGQTFEVFGFASYISRMIFASTAPDIETLRLHGNEYGIPQRPASPAFGNITFTTTATALTVDTGAILTRADGIQYIVQVGGAITAPGTLQVPATALLDGKASNAIEGTQLIITSGLSVGSTSLTTAAIGGGDMTAGDDVEDIETYRARILFRKRNPPHGGSAADYVIWASQVSGVTRVFVERLWNGAGTVRVFPIMDDLFASGIPDAAAIDRVHQHILGVCPAGVILTTAAAVPHPIDVVIQNLTPNTTAVQEEVRNELRAAFRRLGRASGNDTQHGGMPFLAVPATFSRSWIWQTIANATGEDSHILISPNADVVITPGQMATLGDITFI